MLADLRDSDGVLNGLSNHIVINHSTSGNGENDNSLDFGFYFCASTASTVNDFICEGSSYDYYGNVFNTGGSYNITLTNVNGCDSLVTLVLALQTVESQIVNDEFCTGDSYFFAGQNLNTAGTYADTLKYQSGCDSVIVTLNLTENMNCLPEFDMALRKTLGANQDLYVDLGDNVTFTITVFNQGDLPAYNILVLDQPPLGLDFNTGMSIGWFNFGAGPSWFIPGPLNAGDSLSIDITFTVGNDAVLGSLINYAEITSADDDLNNSNTPPKDIDSTPNAFLGDDPGGTPGTPADNVITGDGTGSPSSNDPATDEDDHDGERVIYSQPILSIGDLVFADLENDGYYNNSDYGIEDVEVKLFSVGVDNIKGTADDAELATQVTNGFGEYNFTGLFDGVYYVKLTGNGIPTGFISSTGEGVFDNDGSGPFEPYIGTDNDFNNEDDGTQMGSMIMSDIVVLEIYNEPDGNAK